MGARLIPLILLLFTGSIVIGQTAKFYIETDAKEVIKSGYFEVSFIVENGKMRDFTPPVFDPFIVVSGPSQSSSFTSVNGKTTQSKTITYGLQGSKTGNFSIGSASALINGKKMSTRPTPIKVVKSADGKAPNAELFYLKAIVEKDSIYPGQQVTISYVLYTTVGIENYNNTTHVDFGGFYTKRLRPDGKYQRTVIDGVQYTTKELSRIALFPQKAGTYELNPYGIRVGIKDKKAPRQRGFFSMVPLKYYNISSNSLKIEVMPFPDNQPETFSGSVGYFEGKTTYDKSRLSTDDVLTVRAQVIGDGDPKRIMAPEVSIDGDFDVYDPKIISDITDEVSGTYITKPHLRVSSCP